MKEGVMYPDNDDCKGWNIKWVPDIIHVHGWMAAMLPIYMKHYYKWGFIQKLRSLLLFIVNHLRYFRCEMINKIILDGRFPRPSLILKTDYESIIKPQFSIQIQLLSRSDNLSPSLTKFISLQENLFYLSCPRCICRKHTALLQ
jgi:starch synthase